MKGEIADGVLPKSKDDVLGAMLGTASVKWSSSGSTILPGAICEHLTSFGGAMRETAGQTPLSEFIRFGAAGTSGTVTEPYAIQAKFPFPFIHVHYARGCSLAEAFYQSVFGPYQLLIVGDPLCQPWANRWQIQVDNLKPNQTVSGQVVVQPKIVGVADSDALLDHYELFVDGRRGQVDLKARRFSIDTRELGDGWHELRVVAIAAGPIETQSSLVLPLHVNNGGKSVELELAGTTANKISYGEEIVVQAKAAGAPSIAVAYQGLSLGSIEGAGGSLRIDSHLLGMGPVQLQASAMLEGKTVYSKPLDLVVDYPAVLPPVRGISSKQLEAGIAMRLDGKEFTVVESTKDAKWLAETKPDAGRQLELDAYFSASADDLYQFQFKGNAAGEVLVDGVSLWQTADPAAGRSSG